MRARWFAIAALSPVLLLACGSAISVRREPERLAPAVAGPPTRDLELSAETLRTLRLLYLDSVLDKYPSVALQALDRLYGGTGDPAVTAATAELALREAERLELEDPDTAQGWYLLAAERAWEVLFAPAGDADRVFDPRRQQMIGVYEHAVSGYVCGLLREGVDARLQEVHVLAEDYRVLVEVGPASWDPGYFDELVPAETLDVRGFRNHYRQAGLGAPLVGIRENRHQSVQERFYPPEGIIYPTTAVLRFDEPGAVLREERRAVLAFYDPRRQPSLRIAGRQVPLAADFTAAYALLLDRSPMQRLARSGWLEPDKAAFHQGLFMHEPYDPNQVPVLMIHGLRSSPEAWAELTNDLTGDPALRGAFQVWHYMYPTGLPFFYSAAELRQALAEARRTLDPEGDDPAMQDMVVVAHSMGGLLARTLVSDSGDRLWKAAFTVPPEQLDVTPGDLDRLRDILFFERQTWIRRVIFISTPHRGSRMADAFVGKLGSGLVRLPDDLITRSERIVESNLDRIQPGVLPFLHRGRITSIRSMSPSDPMLRALAEIPIAPEVPYHTIVGDRGTLDPELASDGVVTYDSAHLAGAASELRVDARHDAYSHPLAIREVERILRLHLQR